MLDDRRYGRSSSHDLAQAIHSALEEGLFSSCEVLSALSNWKGDVFVDFSRQPWFAQSHIFKPASEGTRENAAGVLLRTPCTKVGSTMNIQQGFVCHPTL